MRLSIIVSAGLVSTGLLLALGLNKPAISQSPAQVAQSSAIANTNLQEFRQNRRVWSQQRIRNYRYKVSRSCFCTEEARGPVTIEVRNGQTVSITDKNGKKVNPELFQEYSTLPKVFNVIRDAIAKRASSMNVNYNKKLGYPTQINIDYNSQMADEELYLTIEDFKEIK
ncbi:hypothetical protein HCG51_01430 [Tolypothrix sp. PCC 7910]|uniref:DUF6174 domain-containing protein n=1 Tax=Tolypothrix sp. PCC 7910 TaxID=2099387 RepID=UPI00142795C4|nr:DUF6174 domain-containing protein [Tolypothrix sp. PCC 7910]QIR35544.1 hypothetical protein HCG51_01430 [Tolypothrix sp. PCC 7910]